MNLPKVTAANYYQSDIQMVYMGATQFKAFQKCEAAAMAELKGEYTRPASTALLVGGYIDAHFSGEENQYRAAHPEMFKRDGSLKAEFCKANRVIEKMESDELYMMLMDGEKQVIKTGYIADVPFKIKMDVKLSPEACRKIVAKYPQATAAMGFCNGAIVDQKAMSNFEDVWSEDEHRRIPFVEAWGYDTQGAIYQEIDGEMLPFIIAAGSKEEEPDLAALYIPDDDLAVKLAEVEDMAPRYQAIKQGIIQPKRCEKCAYCRSTRKLLGILDYKEVLL